MMTSAVSLSPEDLRTALLRRAGLHDIESALVTRTRLPSPRNSASSPLYHLRQTGPEFTDMMVQWMKGYHDKDNGKPVKLKKVPLVPFCPHGINVSHYLKPIIKRYKPSVIAIDASIVETGGALFYASSLYYALNIPVKVSLVKDSSVLEECTFNPGDFLPELAGYCYKHKIPLISIGAPVRLVPSEHQFVYNQLLQGAYNQFGSTIDSGEEIEDLEKKTGALMQQVFHSGLPMVLEREDLVNRSCYLASRLLDLALSMKKTQYEKGTLLTLYKMDLSLDFPQLLKTFQKNPALKAELYSPLEPQHDGTYAIEPVEEGIENKDTEQPVTKLSRKTNKAVTKFLSARMDEQLSLDEVDRISSEIAMAVRNHPFIERPPGVRGTLATREIAQAYGLIRGKITRHALAQSAFIAFRHRTGLNPGENTTIEEIFKGIFSKLIYGIPLYPEAEEPSSEKRRPLTPEEISDALMGLSDAAFQNFPPEDGLPIDDPAFAEEAMKHPLVQQALQEAMEKGLLDNLQDAYHDLLNELEDRNYLELADSSHMTLTEDGQQKLKESLEERMARGELSPEELAEALKNANSMPLPDGLQGDKMMLSPKAETELMAEMMDFQHEGRSSSTSLEDLYVHYTLNEKKGMDVLSEKVDYEKLKIIIHELEKKGLVNISGTKKRFTLSHLSLEKLLEGLIRKQESQVLERRAFRREHETDKTEVRRYKRGDVFNDISTRHTLRRLIRKGKNIEDINYTDLRSFEKKPSNQLDIAICVDISASMKESGKLRYAKMAVAELGKAALGKNDRIGIVVFSNLGQVLVPLTDKITPLLEAAMTMRAEQYTNIGNGLRCARKMLLKNKNSNPKYIILITDGQPNAALSDDHEGLSYHSQVASFSRQTTMETKRAMGTHHALVEAGKTAREHIKISVVFISPEGEQDEEGERTVREIARIGRGKFHKVNAIERLPMEALATVG